MRRLIYLHLVAVALCALFSLADRGLLWSPAFSEMVLPFSGVLLLPSMIALVVCPLGTLAIARRSPKIRQVILPILVEIVLVIAQLLALLPGVQ